jgi:hypothetical protein
MRRNPGTVLVLAGPAPAEVLAAVGQSMNATAIVSAAAARQVRELRL